MVLAVGVWFLLVSQITAICGKDKLCQLTQTLH